MMKATPILYSVIFLTGITLSVLAGCESHPPTPGVAAFEKVKNERAKTADSVAFLDAVFEQASGNNTNDTTDRNTITDPLTALQQTANRKIRSNERKIEALKDQPGITISYFKKLSQAERNNMEAKIAVSEFAETDTEAIEEFRQKIMKDLEDISDDLEKLRRKISGE